VLTTATLLALLILAVLPAGAAMMAPLLAPTSLVALSAGLTAAGALAASRRAGPAAWVPALGTG